MKPVAPGSVLGIMGSGQLGRMFCQKAVQNGYSVICYSEDKNTPAKGAGAIEITGSYSNKNKLLEFLQSIDALTFEFENIPAPALAIIDDFCKKHKLPVSPSAEIISISQNRHREKKFIRQAGLQTADFVYFSCKKEIRNRIQEMSFPCILKTNSFGYDGKGQFRCNSRKDLENIFPDIPENEYIAESFVAFDLEISIIAARFADGTMVFYPASENIHTNGILDLTIHPARIPESLMKKAKSTVKVLLEKLDYTGVAGVEMFVQGNRIIINEFAPRPHNSGHFTMDAASFSQFDLQLRTLCNIPFRGNLTTTPCLMKNILGETYANSIRLAPKMLLNPQYHLHLYGKKEAKSGRKMGHWNYSNWNQKQNPAAIFRGL